MPMEFVPNPSGGGVLYSRPDIPLDGGYTYSEFPVTITPAEYMSLTPTERRGRLAEYNNNFAWLPVQGSEFDGTYDSPNTQQRWREDLDYYQQMENAANAGKNGDYGTQFSTMWDIYSPVIAGAVGLGSAGVWANRAIQSWKFMQDLMRKYEQERAIERANELARRDYVTGMSDMAEGMKPVDSVGSAVNRWGQFESPVSGDYQYTAPLGYRQ